MGSPQRAQALKELNSLIAFEIFPVSCEMTLFLPCMVKILRVHVELFDK